MTTLSVITPSFQQAKWLRLAIRSVADQRENSFELEHIVQDACSSDGTEELLKHSPNLQAVIEKDTGMYDAVNRGMRRSRGEIVAYLNCDEQYLPGVLSKVVRYFEKHPEIDMLFGGMVVVDAEGNYLCSRKTLPPLRAHTQVCHLSTFTCTTFFRRSILQERGLFFDEKWKAVGDADWILRCLESGVTMAALPEITSAFVETGENLGFNPTGIAERIAFRKRAPLWAQYSAPLIAAHHRLRRLLGGVYRQIPFEYSIFTQASPSQRQIFSVPRPTTIWKQRFTLLR